ncbi:hypothetical protein [Jidongwangia harbinensis]|uniref:hypothetical protein n=1 Tax=Jidongwangia harbinensis TaxID=2878561 RepID=UPI001CDA2BDB|nr:hypothetical protein [Jidongwangia harbinensis]MCA2216963.1 hypothetical protein [Jidongwangia harbinensis]
MTVRTMLRSTTGLAAALATVVAVTLAGPAAPAQAAPWDGFTASCSTASPVLEYWATGKSWAQFDALATTHFNAGRRVAQFDIEGNGITAVWQPGTGTERIRWNHDWDEFLALDSTYFAQGLRLVDIDRDGDDWAGVWRPGSGGQFVRSGIPSWKDFENENTVQFNRGRRLVDVVIEDDDDIAAVWRGDQGTAAEVYQYGIPATGVDENNMSEFDRVNARNKRRGYDLKILKTHPNDSYVMAVWRHRGGSFGQSDTRYQRLESFETFEANCRSAGRMITTIDVK